MTTREMDPVFASALARGPDRACRARSPPAPSLAVASGYRPVCRFRLRRRWTALAAGVFRRQARRGRATGNVIVATRTGSATVDLGPAPATATNVSLTLTCLSVGKFDFPDGSYMTCSPADISGAPGSSVQSTEVVSLQPGQHTVTIDTSGTRRGRFKPCT